MKFSYSWLKDLSGYNGSAEKLAEVLSVHACETEVISSGQFDGIIAAKVIKVEKHPNADRLRVITLTDGKQQVAPVVCGAWNFDVGAIVPLALPGAKIPHDQHDPAGNSFVLAKAVIRGIESQGMICSGKELGLSDDGKGILLLDNSYELGKTFAVKNTETYLDISIPANRPDLFGYRGVAREIAALTGSKITFSNSKNNFSKLKPKVLKVSISNPKLCHRFTAVRLSDLEVGLSPEFIQKRLLLAGHKPINNVVDITNFVMLETGQPMHAFDAAKVFGGLNVRPAYVNEQITTLDGEKRKLSSDQLVVADSKQAVAVAGIMGGLNSMVDNFTTEVILEAANWESTSIRRTARELGLRTDAAVRFEKSLPLGLTNEAQAYAVSLFVKYAKAKPLEFLEVGNKIPAEKKIKYKPEQIESLLGIKVAASKQKEILTKLGFKVSGKDSLTVVVPFERADVSIWQDLAEEVGRIIGLDQIDEKPINLVPSAHMTNPLVDFRQKVSDLLTGLGFSETYTYSFLSAADLAKWQIEEKMALEVANPLTADQKYMRPNILVNMLKVADLNSRYFSSGNYFEIGNIYWKEGSEVIEKMYLGLLSFDKTYPLEKLTSSFRELCRRLKIEIKIAQESEQLAAIYPKNSKKIIGRIGRISVGNLSWVGVHLDFEEFCKLSNQSAFTPPSRYPAVEIDVSVLAKNTIAWAKIEDLVKSIDSAILKNVQLFDIYSGKNLGPNKKSLTFRIIYQSDQRTLTDAEVQKVHTEVLKELKNRLNLEVR